MIKNNLILTNRFHHQKVKRMKFILQFILFSFLFILLFIEKVIF